MMKLYRIIKFFFIYRKNILKNGAYLQEKYGFNMNFWCEIYTTLTLVDAPKDIKDKFGKAFIEIELKKFIALINKDLPKLELDELMNVYEIKRIDDDNWGIAFGYALANNRKLIITLILILISIITILGILLF